MYRLSKSRLMSALQCPKRLYLEVHAPQHATVDSAMQGRFDTGHRVGEVARALHPEGRLVGHPQNVAEALRETEEALAWEGDLLLFEPAFRHGGVVVRADLLFRRGGRYRLVEVKATTSVHDEHLQDAAIQAWVIDGAGYPVDSLSIAHVDNRFVYPGGGDYRRLLKTVDVTDEIASLRADVPALTLRCQQLLAGALPEIATGYQCTHPYSCPFFAWCDRDAPEYPLSLLGKSRKLKERLAAQGYRDLRDVPATEIEGRLPRRIWNAVMTGDTYVGPKAAEMLRELPYPRYFLDFETIQFAVPIWKGTRPYEQLPFQWSCDIVHENGSTEHREFLDTTGKAPMRACMDALVDTLGTDGPVFMYTGFERRVLRGEAERNAALAPRLDAICERLVDLHAIATEHYYHRAQKGSWSVKSVLPTIDEDLDYSRLGEVADGGAAQSAYLELIDTKTTAGRKAALESALRAYCQRDTLGMIRITERLMGAASESAPDPNPEEPDR